MVNKNNSSNSLVSGLWPKTKIVLASHLPMNLFPQTRVFTLNLPSIPQKWRQIEKNVRISLMKKPKKQV